MTNHSVKELNLKVDASSKKSFLNQSFLTSLQQEEVLSNQFMKQMYETYSHHPKIMTPKVLRSLSSQYPSEASLMAMDKTLSWIESFILKPYKKYGRMESVCPFVKPSLDADLFYLTCSEVSEANDLSALYQEMKQFQTMFARMQPTSGPQSVLRNLIIVLPNSSGKTLETLVNPNHLHPFKTELLEEKMMIGQFYPTCPFQATWTFDPVFPHQSPVPFYVIRTLIESDWRFINNEAAWREIYIQHFGPPNAAILATVAKMVDHSKKPFIQKIMGKLARLGLVKYQ